MEGIAAHQAHKLRRQTCGTLPQVSILLHQGLIYTVYYLHTLVVPVVVNSFFQGACQIGIDALYNSYSQGPVCKCRCSVLDKMLRVHFSIGSHICCSQIITSCKFLVSSLPSPE